MRLVLLYISTIFGAVSGSENQKMDEEDLSNFMELYQRMKSGGSLSELAKDSFKEYMEMEQDKCVGGEWSPWMDADDPSGLGDHEPLARFLDKEGMCPNPTEIDARTVIDEEHYLNSGNFVQISPEKGLFCWNHFQAKFGKEFCKDFEVRFCCPKAITAQTQSSVPKFVATACEGYRSEWITIDGPGGIGDLELVESVMRLAPDLLFCQPISHDYRVIGTVHKPLHAFTVPRFGAIGYSNEDITVQYCCKQSTRKDLVLVTGASKSMIKDNESIINWLLFNSEEVQEYTTFWVGIYDTASFQKYSNVDEVIGALRTINGLVDHPPSCIAGIFKVMISIMKESNFQAKIFGFLDRDVDKRLRYQLESTLYRTESTMQLFQTGRSDPYCGEPYGMNTCYGPSPSEEQLVEQFEAMSSNHLLVSTSADYCIEDEDIEPLQEIQQFVQMVSKPDLLSLLIETPII